MGRTASVRLLVSLAAVLGSGAAWAQSDIWEGPGKIVPDEMEYWHYEVTIQTCNDVRAKIEGIHNFTIKYTDTRDILTNGPTYAYSHTIPTGSWGLTVGDSAKIRFTVTHIEGSLNGKSTVENHASYVMGSIPSCRLTPPPDAAEPKWDDRRRMNA